jgi:N-[(2S)-2-amino-2-carboxyethyl]-L-glutamate dehydrogenase
MRDGDILILKGHEVVSLLEGRELDLIETVRKAYEAHGSGSSSLPHSVFLNFPNDPRNRIIALPAYLGGETEVAGIKWVSSFPENINRDIDRASAVVILNSMLTGRPEAIIEGSIISAKRTAASAALAAQCLSKGSDASSVGLLGAGLINFEITRFLLAAIPGIKRLRVFDLDRNRAEQFSDKCSRLSAGIKTEVVKDKDDLFKDSSIISVATTAAKPHIFDLAGCSPGATILHVSLRDFAPNVILSCDNIVDDLDHVCRAQTSIHLTEQEVGNRDFVRCTLADILKGTADVRKDDRSIAIFSPFGLGVLDLAVSDLVRGLGLKRNVGTFIGSFLPDSWAEKKQGTAV